MTERIIVDVSTLGKRLRLTRRARGLSMRALAIAVGVSHNAIKKFEADEMSPRSSVLVALGKTLGVSLDYLAGGTIATLEIISISMAKDSPK